MHTGGYRPFAIDWNFDVKISNIEVSEISQVYFSAGWKGVNRSYKNDQVVSLLDEVANAIVDVATVKFRFGAIKVVENWFSM